MGAWRERLRQRFLERLGGFPGECALLDPRLLEERDCGDYTLQRIEITTYAGLRMPVYLLIPKHSEEQALPAVLALHGHGYGSKEIVGLSPDGEMESTEESYQKNFAVSLVLRGFLVAAPEILGFGDRRLRQEAKEGASHSCHSLSTYLLHMGLTMAGHRVYETIRVLDYLLSRGDIDPGRIGCMGISGGGLTAGFAAALDDRIQASVVSGYVNTFQSSILSIHHCVDNYVPGLGAIAEMPDLIGMIAPRPLLIEAGDRDPIFPVGAVHEAYGQLTRIYRLLGAEDRLALDLFEGDHRINGTVAYDWLVQQTGKDF
ncbi:alpha/beta hydrolase family protein [Paenibacillus sp. CC-CFT747]|nr:alpha/beta hydrolase family protein [Paenibacillus sp. CC-CFT747]